MFTLSIFTVCASSLKCVLHCWFKCPSTVTPSQTENKDTTDTCPKKCLCVYKYIPHFTVDGIHPYKNGQHVQCDPQLLALIQLNKVYTRTELVLLETSIAEYHKKVYMPAIQKMEFYFPYLRILVTHHSGKKNYEVFKYRGELHNVLCWRDYAELVVSSFDYKIKP